MTSLNCCTWLEARAVLAEVMAAVVDKMLENAVKQEELIT